MTKTIVENFKTDGATEAVQVESGRYCFAVGGNFDGATATLHVNIGPANNIPVTDMAYTSPKVDLISLPSCTVYLVVTGAGAATNVSSAISEVITEID
jgi:hypothetical protein